MFVGPDSVTPAPGVMPGAGVLPVRGACAQTDAVRASAQAAAALLIALFIDPTPWL
jgi:hypothetical protein